MQWTAGTLIIAALAAVPMHGADPMKNRQSPEAVVAGFEKRIDAIFRAEAGKPLVRAKKQKPLSPTRGAYVRHYSYSIVAFAARCLYLNEMRDEANAALAENAQYYLDNPLTICDRDSFHWHAEIVLRLLEMYGPAGSVHPGRITPETEAKVLEPMWIYTRKCSWLGKAEVETSKTWHIYSSENHHAMDFTCHWHFAKYAKDRPEYRERKCDDGATLAQHYNAWNRYVVAYCRERARRGLCVEMRSDGYNATLIKGFYNFYDFGAPQVRRAAGMLLDLYFAYWAEEQILGHMGGGGSRVKGNNAYTQNRHAGNAQLAWFYFAIGEQPELSGHDIGAMLSDYRPPAVIADIARDTEGRGRYEIRQRVQGLGQQGETTPHMDRPQQRPNRLRTDGGGIVRYSYCDPAFILGTPMTEARPMSDWVAISTQNRWQGVIFNGEHDPRIVPLVRPKNNRVALNGQWSVQSKGSLITQKIKYHKGAAEMMVWISKKGLPDPVEEDGTVFVEAPGAYAAIRVSRGPFTLHDKDFGYKKPTGEARRTTPGWMVTPKDEFAPVILEVMARTDVESFDAFKARVNASAIRFDGPVLRYTTIYGDTLTLDTSWKRNPTINGKPVDYAPAKVFDSPFLSAEYLSGVVTIRKGQREKVLDFNAIDKPAAAGHLRIGLIGDSTVAVQSGWGPALGAHFGDTVQILHYAVNGATLESLDGKLDALVRRRPDYVLIQFGHNDQKRYGTDEYARRLRSYVDRVLAAGARPIVLSSVTRRSFGPDGSIVARMVKNDRFSFHAPLDAYAQAAGRVAAEAKVPFIDLYALSVAHHNTIGRERSMTYNFKEDDCTHFNRTGAEAIANLIIPELLKAAPELQPHLLP